MVIGRAWLLWMLQILPRSLNVLRHGARVRGGCKRCAEPHLRQLAVAKRGLAFLLEGQRSTWDRLLRACSKGYTLSRRASIARALRQPGTGSTPCPDSLEERLQRATRTSAHPGKRVARYFIVAFHIRLPLTSLWGSRGALNIGDTSLLHNAECRQPGSHLHWSAPAARRLPGMMETRCLPGLHQHLDSLLLWDPAGVTLTPPGGPARESPSLPPQSSGPARSSNPATTMGADVKHGYQLSG